MSGTTNPSWDSDEIVMWYCIIGNQHFQSGSNIVYDHLKAWILSFHSGHKLTIIQANGQTMTRGIKSDNIQSNTLIQIVNALHLHYTTSGKILGIWLAKRNQISYCIRLPIIPHHPHIILIYRHLPYIIFIYPGLIETPIFSSLHLVSPVFTNTAWGTKWEWNKQNQPEPSL